MGRFQSRVNFGFVFVPTSLSVVNHSDSAKIFTEAEIRLHRNASMVVENLPGCDLNGDPLRSHEVVRIVEWYLRDLEIGVGMQVVDGRYGSIDHSWIRVVGREVILDPCTLGRVPVVQLISTELGLGQLYVEGQLRQDIRWPWNVRPRGDDST